MGGFSFGSIGLFPFKVLLRKSVPVFSEGFIKGLNMICSVLHWIHLK